MVTSRKKLSVEIERLPMALPGCDDPSLLTLIPQNCQARGAGVRKRLPTANAVTGMSTVVLSLVLSEIEVKATRSPYP